MLHHIAAVTYIDPVLILQQLNEKTLLPVRQIFVAVHGCSVLVDMIELRGWLQAV
jgi:hypothetical protein